MHRPRGQSKAGKEEGMQKYGGREKGI